MKLRHLYFFTILLFCTSCKFERDVMIDGELPLSSKNGFEVPRYAINVKRRIETPEDVFYFEIPAQSITMFMKTIEKYPNNCNNQNVTSGIEQFGKSVIEKFNDILVCHEDNDGELVTYESLLVSEPKNDERISVFYAYWD